MPVVDIEHVLMYHDKRTLITEYEDKKMSNQTEQAIDYVELCKAQTARANLAEWRISALKHTSVGFTHLRASYGGQEQKLAEILTIADLFNSFYDAEIKKLQTIASTARSKAQWAMDMFNGQGE